MSKFNNNDVFNQQIRHIFNHMTTSLSTIKRVNSNKCIVQYIATTSQHLIHHALVIIPTKGILCNTLKMPKPFKISVIFLRFSVSENVKIQGVLSLICLVRK